MACHRLIAVTVAGRTEAELSEARLWIRSTGHWDRRRASGVFAHRLVTFMAVRLGEHADARPGENTTRRSQQQTPLSSQGVHYASSNEKLKDFKVRFNSSLSLGTRTALKKRSVFRTFISNSYVRSYYEKTALQCPTLAALGPEVIATVSDFWIMRVRTGRRVLLPFMLYSIIWYVAVLKTFNSYVIVIGIIPILVAQVAFSFKINRSGNEGLAASRLFRVIAVMESNPDLWRTSAFRWDIARRVELVAKSIERIPLGLSPWRPA